MKGLRSLYISLECSINYELWFTGLDVFGLPKFNLICVFGFCFSLGNIFKYSLPWFPSLKTQEDPLNTKKGLAVIPLSPQLVALSSKERSVYYLLIIWRALKALQLLHVLTSSVLWLSFFEWMAFLLRVAISFSFFFIVASVSSQPYPSVFVKIFLEKIVVINLLLNKPCSAELNVESAEHPPPLFRHRSSLKLLDRPLEWLTSSSSRPVASKPAIWGQASTATTWKLRSCTMETWPTSLTPKTFEM